MALNASDSDKLEQVALKGLRRCKRFLCAVDCYSEQNSYIRKLSRVVGWLRCTESFVRRWYTDRWLRRMSLKTTRYVSACARDHSTRKVYSCLLLWKLCGVIVNICRQSFYHTRTSSFQRAQWRREGVCRPGQTSVLPPPLIRLVLQSGYFSGFRTSRVWTNFWGPFLYPPFLFLPLPSPLFPFHPLIIPQRGLGRNPNQN